MKLVAAAILLFLPTFAFASDTGNIVATTDGPVRGLTKNGVNIFLGIPYAEPPVGPLRWQPPQPVNPWHEPYDATRYSGICTQVTGSSFAAPQSINEDCLYLNVFVTPGRRPGQKKPVIIWLHGGGNLAGASDDYDASKLATGGPNGVETVVITVNYRLGLFGTLSHPALNAEGHPWGNYTVLDQQAAMRWVQRNIAAFGGDPTKVALGGQSTGATDVGSQMLSPGAKGLFNRAIMQSTPGYLTALTEPEAALKRGVAFAAAIGCPGPDAAAADCLRHLSPARILQLQGTSNTFGPYGLSKPIVDGTIIPLQPDEAWKTGRFSRMPIMGGATKDEAAFNIGRVQYFAGGQMPISAAQYASEIAREEVATAPGLASAYPLSEYGSDPTLAYTRVTTDPIKCQDLQVLQKLAPRTPTYAYDFTYQNAPYYFPKMLGFRARAAHTVDIQFLFAAWHGGVLGVNLDQSSGMPRELNGEEIRLSDQIVGAWTRFADTGNPNGSGNAPWPKLEPGTEGVYLVQDIPIKTKSTRQYRSDYKCDFWEKATSR